MELARRLAASAEGMTLDEMAAALGVVRRTAERYRDAVEALFPQMEVLTDGAVKRYRIPKGLDGFFQAPTTEEMLELTKAATALKSAGHTSQARSIETLELKVRAAMKGDVLRKIAPDVEVLARAEMSMVRVGPRPHEDSDALTTIRQAIMAMRAIRFRYNGGSKPGSSRTVCPYGILFERMNYLVAAELGVDQVRNWRLDRIESLELTDEAACAPQSFKLEDYANQSFGIYRDGVEAVVLRILPHGAEDARSWRFHPSQQLSEQPDGSIIVRFNTSGMRELAWHLFSWGDKVEIEGPPRLKSGMLEELRLSCLRHGFPDPTVPVAAPA